MRPTLLISALLLVLLALPAGAATFMVYPNPPAPGGSIQDAIDAASDGDTILLADGVFRGEGNTDLNTLGKAITICSASGDPEACILDAEGIPNNLVSERAFTFNSGETRATVIADLSIIHGDADAP